MQSAQQDRLQQLIGASPILTAAEKAEWLDMLILMNDKQATELEEILKANVTTAMPTKFTPAAAPVRPAPSLSKAVPPPNLPHLSHISNLPAQFASQPVVAKHPQLKKISLPWAEQLKQRVEEKELPAPTSESKPKQIIAPETVATIEPARVAIPPAVAAPSIPVPPIAVKRVSIPVVETLTDVGGLTVNAVRTISIDNLLNRLQQLVKLEGYFNVLSFLEDSPLYKAYILTGKKILANQLKFETANEDHTLLSKEEFENVTDILRQIQLN